MKPTTFTLDDFLANPPDHQEWIDGLLVETTGMTIKHSEIQLNLGRHWANYVDESGQGGKVYTELPCKTNKQGRRPDVSYLTPELAAKYEDEPSLPQSPPLIAEIASPNDSAEDLFSKTSEYLSSGCQEVWLILPESKRILIITSEQTLSFTNLDVITTQKVLMGFRINVSELLG